ncbi:hypothetical protein PMAYCL1PPCAC_28038, partial [Pristionchus mayeri]
KLLKYSRIHLSEVNMKMLKDTTAPHILSIICGSVSLRMTIENDANHILRFSDPASFITRIFSEVRGKVVLIDFYSGHSFFFLGSDYWTNFLEEKLRLQLVCEIFVGDLGDRFANPPIVLPVEIACIEWSKNIENPEE